MMNPEQEALIGQVFETYLTEHHHEDLLQRAADTNEDTHHSVVVNAMTLFEANMEVGDYFNAYPSEVLTILDEVLQRKAMDLSDDASSKHGGQQRSKDRNLRKTFHTRITGLPVCPELTRHTVPRSRDVGHFLSVTGTVIRTSVAKVLEYERDYMCTKCKHVFKMQADFDQFYTFVPPVSCPSPAGCSSFKFTCLSGGSDPAACRDYQEIKIQEQVQRLSVGCIPRSLVVVLEDDLVDRCKSGDDVTVYGVTCLRWKPLFDGIRCDVELVLKANHIEVKNQQAAAALLVKDVQKDFDEFWDHYKYEPLAGRNQILLSLCPKVFGMYVVKLAVAMVLAGGVQRIDCSGTRVRGECHMLLVGDPGTGKSQFLKYAAKIISRSVLTAGIGSTSAGLTVAAVKDGGDWHLEAGALVLSDGGLCCIDEFNSIKEHDRISIHEAMEQQSISVAKAGMVCKLNTRTSILAATNPKGRYDPSEPLSVNVALASPLLSRFDLVLVLLDTRNSEWDKIISSFILEDGGLPVESSALWSMEKMKAYFSVIKQLQPQVSEEAKCILTRYYQLQRQRDARNAARTTIRMLESLSRLAEAHARLMYRETVTVEDAVTAVSVMECSMQGGALLGNVNALLTSFPADPVQQYQTQCQILLEGLGLPQYLQGEMDRLTRLRNNVSETFDLSCDSGGTRDEFLRPSTSLDVLNSPIVTSTQISLGRNPDDSTGTNESNHQNEERDAESCEDLGEKITQNQEENHQSEKRKGKLLGSAFSKASKDLRDGRVQPLVLSRSDGQGRNNVTNWQNPQSGKKLEVQAELPAEGEEEESELTEMKRNSSVLSEESETETGTDQHVKLSAFMFKPKKMKFSEDTAVTLKTQISGSQEDRARKKKRKTSHTRSENGSSGIQSISGEGENGSEAGSGAKRLRDVQSSEKDQVFRRSVVTESNKHTRTSTSTGAVTSDENIDTCTLRPSLNPNTCKSGTFQLGHIKNSVSASTIAQLSRFSFSCSAEPATTSGTKSPLQRLNTESIEEETGSSTRTKTHEPFESTVKIKDGFTPTSEELDQRTESKAQWTDATTRRNATELQADASTSRNTVIQRKRKCFQLRPPNNEGSKRFLSELSLFGSTEGFNDVLDTDWDQEVLKSDRV